MSRLFHEDLHLYHNQLAVPRITARSLKWSEPRRVSADAFSSIRHVGSSCCGYPSQGPQMIPPIAMSGPQGRVWGDRVGLLSGLPLQHPQEASRKKLRSLETLQFGGSGCFGHINSNTPAVTWSWVPSMEGIGVPLSHPLT